ncbi:hypothetical protein DW352_10225 [Pseudolabrys taiwanensis]|uniref:Uncharacterized protein n=1 Tax=Pseudolabrys taiwanensis TaxID=331696 RepID=A0A345ZVA5_9HYPH|nr:hypothetical protein DW352_10225 [Pseudolabrys taiwanensis]
MESQAWPRTSDESRASAVRALGATSRRRDVRGLDRREGNWRRISDAPARPPLPAPRLETLIRHPSLSGRDRKDYNQ